MTSAPGLDGCKLVILGLPWDTTEQTLEASTHTLNHHNGTKYNYRMIMCVEKIILQSRATLIEHSISEPFDSI